MRLRETVKKVVRRLGYDLVAVESSLPPEIRGDYQNLADAADSYSFKFLDMKTFLPITMNRAYRLGLTNSSKGLRILDIGTGVGWFPFVCGHYGHEALAVDRAGNQVFKDACSWLGVNRIEHEITPMTPLPSLGASFDVVTAFMVNFDRLADDDYAPWGVPEWEFFINDIVRHQLARGGLLTLLLNPHTMRNDAVMDLFGRIGQVDRGGWIEIKPTEDRGDGVD